MKVKHAIFIKITALLLIFALICPIGVQATEPRASYYLDSYSAYIYCAGWGKIQVWATVTGVDDMDEIGSLSIQLYESTDQENWTWVDTFQYVNYPDMLGYNTFLYSGHIEYAGTIGRYYKAYVCVWAGKDGKGDTRYFWTSPKKATLFAEPTVS
jgi:hypothetical protein